MLLKDDPRSAQFGTIGVDAEGRVRRIANRLRVPGHATADSGDECAAGVYAWVNLLDPRIFDWLPDKTRFSHLDDWFLAALGDEPGAVRGYVAERGCRWEPVGTPQEYWEANFGDFRPSYFDPEALATRRGVRFQTGAVLGRGAEVAPGAELDGVIVWDDERVPAGSYHRGVFAGGAFHACDAPGEGC